MSEEAEREKEYFTGRAVADLMEEYSEQHDEWQRLPTEEHEKDGAEPVTPRPGK